MMWKWEQAHESGYFLRVLGPEPWRVAYCEPLAVLPMVDTEKTLTGFMNIINFRLLLNLHLLIFRIYI